MKLLFDFRTKGHHVEYIHHMYMSMVKQAYDEYVIVVPEDLKKSGKEFDWPKSKNVSFDFIPIKEADNTEEGNLIQKSYKKTRLLKKYVKKHNPTDVFLISLIGFIPFLPFMISKKVHVSGIIYKIYLYEWKQYSRIRKAMEIFKYKCMTFNNCLKHIMILNDMPAAAKLNGLYKTDKFMYMPDPFNKTTYIAHNIREELGIAAGNKVFLHFGSMNRRKGTLNILRAILEIPDEQVKDITLIIAGSVRYDIKKDFYTLLEEAKKKPCQLLIYDEFCSNEFISNLCETCDFILIPYEVVAQSSGLIGYAANYHVPVIAPSKGLLGKLIRRYKIGVRLPEVGTSNIAKAMTEVCPFKTDSVYSEVSSIESFQNQIAKVF